MQPENHTQLGIYIHWPFCASKCPYCDFNSHVRAEIDEQAWANAYQRALGYYASFLPKRKIVSVFFGGGTPSLMAPETVEAVLSSIHKSWDIDPAVEITMEANPTSVESEKFKNFRHAGVNRVSLGVQALSDPDLKFLGREHSAAEALHAVDIARQVFDHYSFDLIYARPKQNLQNWEKELEQAVSFADGHLSLYQLTIERSTPFYMDYTQGKFSVPDEEQASTFYHVTQDVLEAHHMPAYEISNHAYDGQESRHNMIYWRYEDYIGIGPGAHGRITREGKKWATRDHSAPEIWLEKVHHAEHGAHPYDKISNRDRFIEELIMGLRLREGVDLQKISQKSGSSVRDMVDIEKLNDLKTQGWVRHEKDMLSLSREGFLRLNAILPYILCAET